jgi:hypothetical protein
MYDLTARTSLQRSLKDLMWFAPAYQEVSYTWLVKVPSQASWPIGALSVALKGAGLIDMLAAAGVIRKNQDGERVIVIPGLAGLIEKLTGQKVPGVIYGKLSGLNLVSTGGGVPGLSIPANWALGEAALRQGGIFKDISDIFQPYGPDTALLPQPITFAWEALMGSAPPLLSPAKVKADWDKSLDIGIQYAYAELNADGRKVPRFEDYGKKVKGVWKLTPKQSAAYEKDKLAYVHELFTLGKRYQQGIAWVRALGSTVAPMSLSATSKEKQEWDNFWNKLIEPEFSESQRSGFSDRQRDLIDGYIEDNPNSLAFATFYRGQGEKVRELPFPEDLDDAFYDAVYTGEKVVLSPKDFTKKLMASESRRYYQAQLDQALNEVSPTRDPWELLTKGFEKKTALADYRKDWGQYLALNEDEDALLRQQSDLWKKNNDFPTQSYAAERTADLYNILWEMSPMLTGEEGIRPDYLRRTLTEAAILYSEEGEFGKPNTPEEKAIGWYMTKVYIPRIQEAVPLYEEAQSLQNQGLPAGQIYDQIKQIYNRPSPKYKGKKTPSVEAVFFGNRNEDEQKAAIVSWQSRPISWLSDFQLDKAGYGVDAKTKGFLDTIGQYDTDMWNDIRKRNVSLASKEYDTMKAQRLQVLGAEAQRLGPGVAKIWNLNEAAPIFRLNSQGFGSGRGEWKKISSAVRTITDRIVAAEMSPKGFSQDVAKPMKLFFYQAVAQGREDHPALDSLFVELSHSFPMDGGGYREGAALYEAVFFGNFNEKYIPFDVAQAAKAA